MNLPVTKIRKEGPMYNAENTEAAENAIFSTQSEFQGIVKMDEELRCRMKNQPT